MRSNAGGVEHGGADYRKLRRLGLKPSDITDFSVCINPYPPAPSLLKAVSGAAGAEALSAYPDRNCGELKEALSGYLSRPEEELLPVSGLSEGIMLLARLLVRPESNVVIAGPAYGEYAACSALCGGRITEIRGAEAGGFRPVLNEITDAVEHLRPSVCWLCNPNNPAGYVFRQDEIRKIAESCGRTSGKLIIDEAYINFTTPEIRESSVPASSDRNIIIMRSMTKDFAMPALRLGCICAEPALIGRLSGLQPVWSLSGPAQAAGTAVLRELSYYEKQWARLRTEKKRMLEKLRNDPVLGEHAIVEGHANFFLWKHGLKTDGRRKELEQALLGARILVRSCESFGLDGWLRIGLRSKKENDRLIECLRRLDIWAE